MTPRRKVTFYDAATGMIRRTQRVREGEEPQPREGEGWIEGAFDLHVEMIDVATGEVKPFAAMPVTIEGNTISGIPEGARVAIGWRQGLDAKMNQVSVVAGAPQRLTVRIRAEGFEGFEAEVDFDPAANLSPAAPAHVVVLDQDVVRMRIGAYPELGDQVDAFAKALDEIIAANPALTGPGVAEAKALIDDRKAVKAALPKPGAQR